MPMWDLIDRNGTRLTGLRSEAHWGGKILNVFPLNRSDSLPDWRLGGNFFDVISFLFGCAETHVGGQATFDASEGQWKPGASTVSTRAGWDLGAASSRSLFPQPLSCEHPQYQALHTQDHLHSVAWMRAQFCRGLRWLAAIHPSSHPALRSNHSTLFVYLQTSGKAAFTSSKHSLNFQDCTIWWKPLKTLSYSHGFTIGQQFSSVNVTKKTFLITLVIQKHFFDITLAHTQSKWNPKEMSHKNKNTTHES